MANIVSDIKNRLLSEGIPNDVVRDIVMDLEFSMQEKINFSRITETLTKKQFPIRSEEHSIQNNDGLTNHLINSNNLDALDMMARIGKKADVVFMDLTDERLIFNDEVTTLSDSDLDHKWMTYIESRAKYIKKVLSNKGLLFVSVDDRYFAEARLILDKVMNPKNFVSNMIWKKPDNTIHNSYLNRTKEYVLVYKTVGLDRLSRKENTTGEHKQWNKIDRTRKYRNDYDYAIPIPNTDNEFAYAGGSKEDWEKRQQGIHAEYDWKWMLSKEAYEQRLADEKIKFKQDSNGIWKVYNEFTAGNDSPFDDVVDAPAYGTGKSEVEEMFKKMSKRNTKPTAYYKYLINLHPSENIHILDISGENASVGQAVLEMNEADEGTRTFTLIADENHDGYLEYFAFERLKKQILGFTSMKGVEVEGKGSNLNTYTLTKKMGENDEELFYSTVEFLHNMNKKESILESVEKYVDGLGNAVFILGNDFTYTEDVKEMLMDSMLLNRVNNVYVPFAINSSELYRELVSIGMASPKIKEVVLKA